MATGLPLTSRLYFFGCLACLVPAFLSLSLSLYLALPGISFIHRQCDKPAIGIPATLGWVLGVGIELCQQGRWDAKA